MNSKLYHFWDYNTSSVRQDKNVIRLTMEYCGYSVSVINIIISVFLQFFGAWL